MYNQNIYYQRDELIVSIIPCVPSYVWTTFSVVLKGKIEPFCKNWTPEQSTSTHSLLGVASGFFSQNVRDESYVVQNSNPCRCDALNTMPNHHHLKHKGHVLLKHIAFWLPNDGQLWTGHWFRVLPCLYQPLLHSSEAAIWASRRFLDYQFWP